MTSKPETTTHDPRSAPLREKCVVGGMLRHAEKIGPELMAMLSADDFENLGCSFLFAAASQLVGENKPVEMPQVFELTHAAIDGRTKIAAWRHSDLPFAKEAKLDAILAELLDAVGTSFSALESARDVRDHGIRRRAIAMARDVPALMWECEDGESGIEQVLANFAELQCQVANNSEFPSMADLVRRSFDRFENAAKGEHGCLDYGISNLDEAAGGIRPSSLTIIAARPSEGKTALMARIAVEIASTGKPVAFFSLEQPTDELMDRLLAMESGVPLNQIHRGNASDDDVNNLGLAGEVVSRLPLTIIDDAMTANRIVALTRKLRFKNQIQAVFIDYLQLIETEERGLQRYQEIGKITRRLKQLAKSLGIPIIIAAQLGRGSEDHKDGPRLSDLRESGNIEQDADTVLMLHKQEPETGQSTDTDLVKIIVGKQRNGPKGYCLLDFIKPSVRFENHL